MAKVQIAILAQAFLLLSLLLPTANIHNYSNTRLNSFKMNTHENSYHHKLVQWFSKRGSRTPKVCKAWPGGHTITK
jgi:hypothetical protein